MKINSFSTCIRQLIISASWQRKNHPKILKSKLTATNLSHHVRSSSSTSERSKNCTFSLLLSRGYNFRPVPTITLKTWQIYLPITNILQNSLIFIPALVILKIVRWSTITPGAQLPHLTPIQYCLFNRTHSVPWQVYRNNSVKLCINLYIDEY